MLQRFTVGVVLGLLISTIHYPLSTPHVSAADDPEIPEFSGRPPDEHPILSPCTRFDDRYDVLGFNSNYIDDWKDIYHTNVNDIVEEYLKQPEIECTAESYVELFTPGPALLDLAASLPTWNDPDVPLSRLDTARVLLEYLRLYECALVEYDALLYYETAQEEFDIRGEIAFEKFFFSDLISEAFSRGNTIKRERIVARKSLHRVLTLIGAFDRLRPLEAELECMQRFSLDVRNIAALSAEASACLPRTWNAKDALRDLGQ